MENETETVDSSNNETGEPQVTETSTQSEDVDAIKKERDELATTNRQLFERAKKAEGFVKVDGKWVKAPKPEEAVANQTKLEATTGELTETQLDYLDLKGINQEEDIEIIQRVMKRAGLTVRQALADDFVQSKLKANKDAREVQNATPSATKRGGQSETNNVDFWVAKVDSGVAQLSDIKDFSLRAAVVDARSKRTNDALPPWRR